MRDALKDQLLRHEGMVLHAYADHLGYLTIGVGRLIDERKGGGITKAEALALLDHDLDRIEHDLDERLSWWRMLGPVRQQALANMAFQLGVDGLMDFRNMLSALRRGDARAASEEALRSLWARQTPKRAHEIAEMIRTGKRTDP